MGRTRLGMDPYLSVFVSVKAVRLLGDQLVYQLSIDEVDAVKERIADVSSAALRQNHESRSDEGLALETSPIVSFTASITLSNTQ